MLLRFFQSLLASLHSTCLRAMESLDQLLRPISYLHIIYNNKDILTEHTF